MYGVDNLNELREQRQMMSEEKSVVLMGVKLWLTKDNVVDISFLKESSPHLVEKTTQKLQGMGRLEKFGSP